MTPPGYDFWVLDLDGTLVDTEWTYTRAVFDRVGECLDRSFSDREAAVLWHGLGGSRNEYLEGLGFDDPMAFWEVFHAVEDPAARVEATYLHDDASFVANLDVPVGLVTHSQPVVANQVLDTLEIRDWFDTVVTCSDDLGWKPDPAPVELAMEHLGVDPAIHDGVLAGDGANDVGAARNAGLASIHVERHDPDRRTGRVRSDYRIASFDELWPQSASD